MAESSHEVTFATGLAIAAFGAAVAALVIGFRAPEPTRLLIYDNETIHQQAAAYIAEGQNPLVVIDTAVQEAVARGYVVVDARLQIKGPPQSILQLSDFVAVGGGIGRGDTLQLAPLPGTIPIETPQTGQIQAPQPAPPQPAAIGSDVEDFARQLMGGAVTKNSPRQN